MSRLRALLPFGPNPDAYLISFPKCGRAWMRVMLGRALYQCAGVDDPKPDGTRLLYPEGVEQRGPACQGRTGPASSGLGREPMEAAMEETKGQPLRQRLWLWGMKVNALQETAQYRDLGFADSTLTVEEAMARTGIANVLMAGGLPLDGDTLDRMPSARRVIAKTSLHRGVEGGTRLAPKECARALRQAQELAAADPRVDAFLLDDFSTGSMAAGAAPEHLARLQHVNAAAGPQLALMGTLYEMSLEDERVWACLPYFAGFLSPLWHAADIDRYPGYVERIATLSGGKPQLACIYLYDFGNSRRLTYNQMARQLEVAEALLREDRVFGVCILGTCMMDQKWEANRCLYEWLERAGDTTL